MILQIFYILTSIACGVCFWQWGLPLLQKHGGILFNFLMWPYPHLKHLLPYPDYTYFILIATGFSIFIFIICEIIYFIYQEKPLTSKGSAHWATKKDVKDLIKSSGVPVGKFNGKILRIDQTHLITCAATRSGKGIGAIIPTLLEYPSSLVCLDIKGENYAVTADRRRGFGKVFALNPFGVLDIKSNSYNWLDYIDLKDPNCSDKALRISSLLVGGSPDNGVESHFNEQAKRLLQGVILLVCGESNAKRNIVTVSDLIHKAKFEDLCQLMSYNGDLAFGTVNSIGTQFLNNTNDKELSGILSTAQRATNFLDNPQIKKTLVKSDFDISQLPDQKMSIYLIMPADKVSDFKAYIKVFFELAFSSLVSRKKRGKYDVLFLLDEVAQLDYFDSFKKMTTLLKGMGGQIWFFFQSVAQLRSIYGKDASTILGNATQIFYGCNDIDTAKIISESLGKKTVRQYKKNGDFVDIGKDLLTPDEVRQLNPNRPIILMSGKPPIMVERLNYLTDKAYRGLFSQNPYFK